ncbi:DUF1810 domain-containing protein [Mucilaginibacter sp. cycad4]|uniref:DUF1810 domain-containing protein n=1 Tax=Mucilaginibacter sp. cycad4 TaxID=3342096 RepID=UPI002AAA99CA|nr:DUF1810 domain-containing protein [Mucilaginibacter gossypii]WPU99055.1 DUF1810 domain-containing protein [Mucilaginibacter gossypii]
MSQENLSHFVKAQQGIYQNALKEIKGGRKRSHWMWFIFPQIDGLGFSEMSKRYSIQDIREAEAYLAHPILGVRLIAISRELLNLSGSDARIIFGSPDDMKLRSSMTLFSCIPGSDEVFGLVLKKFFDGNKDPHTLALLK